MASKFVVFSPIFYYFIATLAAIHLVRFALWRARHTVCVCVWGGGGVRACVRVFVSPRTDCKTRHLPKIHILV